MEGIVINIVSTQYTLKYKSLEIVHSGCDGLCSDECHAKELWEFNSGTPWEQHITQIATKIREFDSLIDWIWVYGGEPLIQDPKDLIKMLAWLTSFKKPVVLFTRFNLNEVPVHVKMLVDYIKTGKYKAELKGKQTWHGIELETTNQRVWKKENDVWI